MEDDYPIQGEPTPLEQIYDTFWGKVTDDMMLEWTKEDTENDMYNMFMDALPYFEFPRFPLYDFIINEEGKKCFSAHLTQEEINILALCMLNTWLQRQVTSVENIRQKYSGSDFKFSSQANHLGKLMELKKECERQCFHMQRLYNRRKLINNIGSIKSNWSTVMEMSALSDEE